MSRYIPITETQQTEMLKELGLETINELFSDVPHDVKLDRNMDLPESLEELELLKHMRNLSSKNINFIY